MNNKNIFGDSSIEQNCEPTIAIIGAGIGGVMSAIVLAKNFPDTTIFLLEKNSELLFGTSNCTPGRAGLGFHYVHPETAITYLRQTINFIKYFYDVCPSLLVGQQFEINHPLRNGRYFIVKDSLFSPKEILATYEKLQHEYARLIKEDSKNKLFGEPHEFYRVLQTEEYSNQVNLERIELGIETREHLLNWPIFRQFILQELKNNSNIKVMTSCESFDIDYHYADANYLIHFNVLNNQQLLVDQKRGTLKADFLVNSTWEWIDYFNSRIGHYRSSEETRTNRLKALVKVKLPRELGNKPSMFFCMGPYCMFSNLGEGFGLITYAPKTNLLTSTALIPSQDYLDLLSGSISNGQRMSLAYSIIQGVSQYIPAMKKAEPIEVRFGTVQSEGEADIFKPDSKVHERDHSGFRFLEGGAISLACAKLLYGLENAFTVTKCFSDYKTKIFPLKSKIEGIVAKKLEKWEEKHEKNKTSLISGLCFSLFKRNYTSLMHGQQNHAEFLEQCCSNFFSKLKVNQELLQKQLVPARNAGMNGVP